MNQNARSWGHSWHKIIIINKVDHTLYRHTAWDQVLPCFDINPHRVGDMFIRKVLVNCRWRKVHIAFCVGLLTFQIVSDQINLILGGGCSSRAYDSSARKILVARDIRNELVARTDLCESIPVSRYRSLSARIVFAFPGILLAHHPQFVADAVM